MMTVKTRSRGKSEEKRLQILMAAGDLFLDNGFEGTSMDLVSTEAGVSKQTVYSHFGCKEELFAAVIEAKSQEHQLTEELLNPGEPIGQVLREWAQHVIELLLSNEAIRMTRVCVAGAENRSKCAELFWDSGPKKVIQTLSHYLEVQHQKGLLTVDNPDFAAQQFFYMIRAEAHFKKVLCLEDDQLFEELPAYLDSCVTLFLKGYQHNPSI